MFAVSDVSALYQALMEESSTGLFGFVSDLRSVRWERPVARVVDVLGGRCSTVPAFSGGSVSTVARLGVCLIGFAQHLDPGRAESCQRSIPPSIAKLLLEVL